MSFEFDSSSDPSLGGSNSDDYGIIMEENRLSSLEGLPQASWLSNPSEHLQKETENSAMPWLTDDPLVRSSLDSSVLRLLPSESQIFPWTFNRSTLFDDDCISEEAVTSSVVEYNNSNNNSRMFLGNQPVGKNFHLQTLADRVLSSIEKLRVFYERISDMARVEEDNDDGYGDSETRFSPPHPSVKVADSLPKLQSCENGRVAKLDASSENFRNEKPVVVAYGKNSYSHEQRRMSQTTEERLTEGGTEERLTESGPVWGIELEGGDSNSKSSCCGVKRSGPKADLDDLLSSLRCLLFVLKNHEETEQLLRSKLQVLRGRKHALHLQKQQYKDIHNKRQRVSQC